MTENKNEDKPSKVYKKMIYIIDWVHLIMFFLMSAIVFCTFFFTGLILWGYWVVIYGMIITLSAEQLTNNLMLNFQVLTFINIVYSILVIKFIPFFMKCIWSKNLSRMLEE